MGKRGMRYGFVAMLFSMLIALAAVVPSTAFADVRSIMKLIYSRLLMKVER